MIKLENIVSKGFNRQTGKQETESMIEYVCDKCRHLVEIQDKYCWKCGDTLVPITDTECYVFNEKVSKEDFLMLKKAEVSTLSSKVSKIKEETKKSEEANDV
jgi:hypothetical protein